MYIIVNSIKEVNPLKGNNMSCKYNYFVEGYKIL